tara:strand:- start:68315 stop:68767 length:453 start_codon:yes stop_codon:yes gene_type:complete
LNVIVNSEISAEHSANSIDKSKWEKLAVGTLQAEGIHTGELNLIFVDSESMKELNENHLGKSEPTDVLAFPLDSVDTTPSETPILLGDVIICPEKAEENAQLQNKTFEEEIALLVLHGILHILGYDHAHTDEKVVMKKREEQLMSELYRS